MRADSIVGNIDHVQEQTARILQEQERDLLRAFRARLFDLQAELEKEKARAEDGAAVWIEKNRQLQKELDWSKEMSERLDRQVQTLSSENDRLRTQYKTQEEDREYLIKQLVAAKKDNARLRQDTTHLKEENSSLAADAAQARAATVAQSATTRLGASASIMGGLDDTLDEATAQVLRSVAADRSHAAGGGALVGGDEARYKDVISRLTRILDAERRATRAVSVPVLVLHSCLTVHLLLFNSLSAGAPAACG